MNNRKKYLALLATAAVATTAVSVQASGFQDVSSTYEPAVNFVVDKGIAKGLSSLQFGVTADITRGDAAVMIAAALKLNLNSAPKSPFTDTNSRIQKSVDALYAAKIISGKSATSFAPDAKITRAEMAKILANAFDLDLVSGPSVFNDVNSNWSPYVNALVEENITRGKTATTFAPTESVTRGEFALFLHRGERFLFPPVVVPPVGDTTAPIFSYTGSTSLTVAYGSNFTTPTVTATDNVDGTVNVTTKITYGGQQVASVNTVMPGTYTITYTASDKAGNTAKLELTVFVQSAPITNPPTDPPATTIDDLNGTPQNPVVFNKDLNLNIEDAGSIDNVVVNGDLTLTGTVSGTSFELINITINGDLDLSGITGEVNLTNVNVSGEIIF